MPEQPSTEPTAPALVTLRASARDEYSWPDTGRVAVWKSSLLAYRWYAGRNIPMGGVLMDGKNAVRAFPTAQEAAAAISAKLP